MITFENFFKEKKIIFNKILKCLTTIVIITDNVLP